MNLNLSSNFIGNSNDETNFWHKLLLNDTQVSKIHKAFANSSSANKFFSKTLLSKMQSRWLTYLIEETIKKIKSDGITTLTNDEIKDIKKVIKSLENRGILLKGTSKTIASQEGGFLKFLRPLMTAGLPLMKNVFNVVLKIYHNLGFLNFLYLLKILQYIFIILTYLDSIENILISFCNSFYIH